MEHSLTSFIKKTLIKTFAYFGIGLYRISKNARPNAQGLPIISPLHHNSRERQDEFYSKAEYVNAYLSPARIAFYKKIIEFLIEKKINLRGKQVADVGCGTGHFLYEVQNSFNPTSITGFEYSKEALKKCSEIIPTAHLELLDISVGTNRKYDFVSCLEVLEHLLEPDIALKNLLRMIGDNGIILITVPNGRLDTFDGHINFFSKESWTMFISKNLEGYEFETGVININQGINYAIVRTSQHS